MYPTASVRSAGFDERPGRHRPV